MSDKLLHIMELFIGNGFGGLLMAGVLIAWFTMQKRKNGGKLPIQANVLDTRDREQLASLTRHMEHLAKALADHHQSFLIQAERLAAVSDRHAMVLDRLADVIRLVLEKRRD